MQTPVIPSPYAGQMTLLKCSLLSVLVELRTKLNKQQQQHTH